MRPKIVFTNVSKSFNLYKKQSDKLLEIVSFKENKDNFYALKNLSFKIFEGEAIGIVGLNGSGKSTLSNLLAQVIPPTSGSLDINGETSLIAISAGLNNQLTGLENIELKCLMHGLKKAEIENLKSEIINFADIGKFINQPVKNYSSGMKSRLGFAISVHTNPDILIVDEALSVGDQTFYEKCLHKINDFKSQGKTIIFISHSISQIKAFCNRVMWVHYGRIEKFDETEMVLSEYTAFIKWFNSLSEEEKRHYKKEMIESQYKDESNQNELNLFRRQAYRKKKNSVKKKRSSFFVLQCILLFLAVIVSASFMFGANPVKGISKYISKNVSKETAPPEPKTENEVIQQVTHQEDLAEEINKDGIVSEGQIVLYREKDLVNPDGEIKFSEEIDVIEKIGDTYKIRTGNNQLYYTKVEDIKIIENELAVAQRNLTEFLPLFPERFANAHAYFLTFLGAEYEEVTATLMGANEDNLENGEKTLSYSIYNAQFLVNSENITESITINNIDIESEQWNELKDAASLKSNHNQYYFFILDQYKIKVDLVNKQATISAVN
ncbi:teichoic acid transport system ATP-binding protein [Neobacillus niacini]|uniref:ATP-binding cassette domain-containing protein n=1 Tax=Neobacillus driksii TaxID=3035913 RepID=UPI002781BD4B|nr:ATP-binding cassette domain-containing protein [Neobacillus niacini]MDQ0974582.1 teichoic acid transport system ATP-binding protein [Neobacillus niacini]